MEFVYRSSPFKFLPLREWKKSMILRNLPYGRKKLRITQMGQRKTHLSSDWDVL
jgi:hypothetical protein